MIDHDWSWLNDYECFMPSMYNFQIMKVHNKVIVSCNPTTLARGESWKTPTPHERNKFSNMIFNILLINTTLHNKIKDKIFIYYLLVYIEKKLLKISINSIANLFSWHIRKMFCALINC